MDAEASPGFAVENRQILYGCGLLGKVHRTAFADDVDLDLSGVFELGFDLLYDVARHEYHLLIVDLIGLDHDPDLSARLNRERFFNAFKL